MRGLYAINKISSIQAFAFSNMHIWQIFNALFIIRTVVKYTIETGSEFQLLQHFEALPDPSVTHENEQNEQIEIAVEGQSEGAAVAKIYPIVIDGNKFQSFFESLVNILVVIPVK